MTLEHSPGPAGLASPTRSLCLASGPPGQVGWGGASVGLAPGKWFSLPRSRLSKLSPSLRISDGGVMDSQYNQGRLCQSQNRTDVCHIFLPNIYTYISIEINQGRRQSIFRGTQSGLLVWESVLNAGTAPMWCPCQAALWSDREFSVHLRP